MSKKNGRFFEQKKAIDEAIVATKNIFLQKYNGIIPLTQVTGSGGSEGSRADADGDKAEGPDAGTSSPSIQRASAVGYR